MTAKKKTLPSVTLPTFESYGPYSGNYGVHALTFQDAGGNQFWFSYKTLVAFMPAIGPRVVHANDWGTTTGKHLNAIDGGGSAGKKNRLKDAAFKAAFAQAFGGEPR